MRKESFSGTHREVGVQQGKRYAENLARFGEVTDRDLLARQIGIYAKHYPGFLEQCAGIAMGGGFPEDRVLFEFLATSVIAARRRSYARKGCTIFGVATRGSAIVGRNYDWAPLAERTCEAFEVRLPEGSYTGISDMYILGAIDVRNGHLFFDPEDAVNDRGLYIGLTFAYDGHWNHGLSPTHMIQLVAERCATVEEALALFASTPLCCPKNFFIADASGSMAVVEHTSRTYEIVRPQDGVLIHTNDYLSALAKEDLVLKERPQSDTYIRYYEALQQINGHKGSFSLADARRILWHGHLREHGKDMRTIWTLVLDMAKRKRLLHSHIGRKQQSMQRL